VYFYQNIFTGSAWIHIKRGPNVAYSFLNRQRYKIIEENISKGVHGVIFTYEAVLTILIQRSKSVSRFFHKNASYRSSYEFFWTPTPLICPGFSSLLGRWCKMIFFDAVALPVMPLEQF